MDLQLHTKLIVVQGFILIMLASVTEQRIPTIVERDPEEWKCDPPCDNNSGKFCLHGDCIHCAFCPEDPFDLDQHGHLNIYKPCIQNGFCPKVCSSYLNLGSYPLANETFCEEINAPKVTTPQPTAEEVVITTTAKSTTGVTSTKPEAGDTIAKNPVDIKNIDKNDSTMATFLVLAIVSFVLVIGVLGCFLKPWKCKQFKKKPRSSGCSPTDTEDTTDTDQLVSSYEPLEIQLSEQNRTATVKGLHRLNCNALQLCACLHNPDRPNRNWMLTQGVDEIQLPGLMIPHQVYTVKAGRVTGEEFECIAKGDFNTQDFSNVTLYEECSTTVGDIFTNVALRRSLQAELYHQDMIDLIVAVFELHGDSYLDFVYNKDLERLYSETLITHDVVESSVHLLLEKLAKHSEAKDFVRKIAKAQRDSETQRDSGWYCKKCLQILHRMCFRNPDETFVVNIPPEC